MQQPRLQKLEAKLQRIKDQVEAERKKSLGNKYEEVKARINQIVKSIFYERRNNNTWQPPPAP